MSGKSLVILFILLCGFAFPIASQQDTFSVAFSTVSIAYDPHHAITADEAQIFTAFYEGLVIYNPETLEPVEGIARRWEKLMDGTLYRFYLRSDAKYSNGDTISAGDFVQTWLRLLDPHEYAEYSSLFDIVKNAQAYRTGKITDPGRVGIRAVSDTILEVELEQPAPYFINILSHHAFVPIHPKILLSGNWHVPLEIPFSGPYRIKEISQDEIICEKNPYYWDRENVKIPLLRIFFNDDDDYLSNLFNQGELDWIPGGGTMSFINDQNAIHVNRLFSTSYMFMKCSYAPLENPDVRRGLAMLMPWEQIRSSEYMLFPTKRLVPGYESFSRNLGFEKQEMREGLELLRSVNPMLEFPPLKIKINDNDETWRIATLIKEAWEGNLKTEVVIEAYPWRRYFDQLKPADYAVGFTTWIADFGDPMSFLQMWTVDSNLNDAEYSNPDYDELLKKSTAMTGRDRYYKMGEAEDLLLDQGVVLPISHSSAVNLINADAIGGWYENLLDIHPFKYMKRISRPLPGGVVGTGTVIETPVHFRQ